MRTSEKIDQIAIALNKAQSEMVNAKRTSENPFFHSKYAELSEVWDVGRDPLTKNGLSFIQSIGIEKEYFTGKIPIKAKDGTERGEREAIYVWLTVTSRLIHISEQWFEDSVTIPVEANPQTIGIYTTYIRRYAAMAMWGIAPEDDDGEEARGKEPLPPKPIMQEPSKKNTATPENISDAQRKRLYAIGKGSGWTDEEMKKYLSAEYRIDSTREIKRSDYETICSYFANGPQPPKNKDLCPETSQPIDLTKCIECTKQDSCV